MSRPHDPHCHPSLLAFGVASLMAVTAATAQVAGGAIDASGDYRQELRACHEGRTAQDLPTCLKEARNAHAEKLRGTLDTAGSLQANALARCNAFQAGDEQDACRARVAGDGETYGSVAEGGILREFAYEVPGTEQTRMGAGTPPPGAAPPADDAQGMEPEAPEDDIEEREPPLEQQP